MFLLADHGFDTYSTLIETRRDLVEKKPDLVQRFVDASAIGWYNYLYGDSRPGNELIKKQNPEMTDALLAYSIAKMKEYGIVDSGDAVKLGIGAMTDARMKSFLRQDGARRRGQGKIDYARPIRCSSSTRASASTCGRNEPRADPAAIVSLRGVGKTFESGTVALDGFNLDVARRRIRLAARAVRLRQVDGAAHHRGPERPASGGAWSTAPAGDGARSASSFRSRR